MSASVIVGLVIWTLLPVIGTFNASLIEFEFYGRQIRNPFARFVLILFMIPFLGLILCLLGWQ